MEYLGTRKTGNDIATQEQITALTDRILALERVAPAAEWSPLSATDVAMMAETGQNRLAGFTDVVYETSTTSGAIESAKWYTRSTATTAEKLNLTTGYSNIFSTNYSSPSATSRGYYKMRVTLTFGYGDSARLIASAKRLILRYTRSTEATQYVKIEVISTADLAAGSTTYTEFGTYALTGDKEWFAIPFELSLGAQSPSPWQIGALRLSFYSDSSNSISAFRLNSIRIIAPECSKADPIAMGGVVLRNGDKTATLAVNDNGDIIINGNINLSALLAAQ